MNPVDALLAAMFTAWLRDIDSEPIRPIEEAALRGEHTAGHELAGR